MKLFFTIALVLTLGLVVSAQQINEFHYDNAGTDMGEFVEISIPDPQPGDLTMYQITHYNGSGGGIISSATLDALPVTCADGVCYYVWTPSSLQNGTEGLALSGPAGVIEFISYEGTVTATAGPANGMTSTNIGVSEGSGTPIGQSIARNAMGVFESGVIATPGAINSNALPISLAKFDLSAQDNGTVLLNWTTESEFDNDFFVIEHSRDGQRFEAIAEVAGAGDSYQAINYDFTHETPARGMNYYRLKQVDYSRAYSFSEVQSLRVAEENELQVWPTLIENATRIAFGDEKVDGELVVTNIQGQVILSRTLENQEGAYDLDLSQVPNGTYVLNFRTNGVHMNRRILVQR